jgi:cyclopropane fatty-acyl-phospholipid synthase-like methyltransferase
MQDPVWKRPDVVSRFLNERSRLVPDRQQQMSVILRLLRASGRPPRRVLDLGAGDAVLLALVLEAFPDAAGVAVDYSPPMLEQARARMAAFGDRAIVVEADLASPDWRSAVAGPFDAVISGFAIHHLSHERKRALYAETFALLEEGGTFVNCEHVASATPRGERLFNEMMGEHLWQRRREAGQDVSLEQVTAEYLARADGPANILAPVEEQCRWLRDIGFAEVDCFWKLFELAVFAGVRPASPHCLPGRR